MNPLVFHHHQTDKELILQSALRIKVWRQIKQTVYLQKLIGQTYFCELPEAAEAETEPPRKEVT